MAKSRAKKITATEMLASAGLNSETKRSGYTFDDQISRVTMRDGSYYLNFEEGKSMYLTASLVRTLSKAFGDDCDEWKGAHVTLTYPYTKLRIRRNKHGLPVMSEQ